MQNSEDLNFAKEKLFLFEIPQWMKTTYKFGEVTLVE